MKVPSIGLGSSTDATKVRQWTRVPSPAFGQGAAPGGWGQWQGGLGGGNEQQQQRPAQTPPVWPPNQNHSGRPRQ